MTRVEARDALSQIMGVDPRMITDSQVTRFLTYARLNDRISRHDEVMLTIRAVVSSIEEHPRFRGVIAKRSDLRLLSSLADRKDELIRDI